MAEENLSSEIAAFVAQRGKLLSEHGSKWVVFLGGVCRGAFESFDAAARYALEHYRDKKFLIRHIDDRQPVIPLLVIGE